MKTNHFTHFNLKHFFFTEVKRSQVLYFYYDEIKNIIAFYFERGHLKMK
jgi:hypothetical protein